MGILLGRVGRGRGRRGFERGEFEGGCSCYYFDISGHMGGGMEILFLIMLFFDAQLTRVMWELPVAVVHRLFVPVSLIMPKEFTDSST